MNDLKFSVRQLLKNPGFTAVAVLTLALGIGANTAIFSVVNAVLLRPLPFADAKRLVWLGGWVGNDREQGVTPADFLDYREQSQSFSQLAASVSETVPMNLTGLAEPERLHGAMVTANYLDVFGIKPALGRTFFNDEDEEGRDRIVVLSHGLWVRRFGSDPSILNKTVTIDGVGFTVVGVMPPQFQYPPGAELWKPFGFPALPESPFRSREFHFLRPVGKLKPGVSLAQAQAEVETVAGRLRALYPKTNTKQSLFLMPLPERIVGNFRRTLYILFGAVSCVLLIACANVASLLLARAASRQREIAVRSALGASRGRLVRQLLTESVILALLGGLSGVLLARWCIPLLSALSPSGLPRADEIGINTSVLAFTLAATLLTGLLFGLVPAWHSSRLDLANTLNESAWNSSGGIQRHRALRLLVIGEMTMAMVLLVGAGLLLNSFIRLQSVRPGFDPSHLLTVHIDLPNPYDQPDEKAAFFDQLQQRMAALPGVQAVGLITELPLAHQSADFPFTIEGRQVTDSGPGPSADIRNVNHDYFRAMRIPLVKGRSFSEAEVRNNAKVVLISEVLARRFFADENPVGQRLRPNMAKEFYEIIGVVGDVRHRGLDVELRQTIYFPTLRLGYANLVIRTAGDPGGLASAVRREVRAINPNQPVTNVKRMDEWLADSVAQPRSRTVLLSVFSALALLLSIVGIYGVVSYAVAQRMREIGLRIALGAQRKNVLALVLHQEMLTTLIGAVLGLLTASALTRVMRSLLYEIKATDALTFSLASIFLIVVAFLACMVPAVRATRVDPMEALRRE